MPGSIHCLPKLAHKQSRAPAQKTPVLTSTSSPASNSHRLRRARLDENLNTQFAVDAPRSRRLRLPSRPTPIRASSSIAAGLTQSTDHVRGNHMVQSSRRVLWSAGSLPCCARAALAYTRMLSKPSRAPRRRNFEWRVFTPPKKTRLSSDCSGRRRKVGLDRDRARSPRPTLMQLPRLGACPSSVCHACPAAPIRSRATPSARR